MVARSTSLGWWVAAFVALGCAGDDAGAGFGSATAAGTVGADEDDGNDGSPGDTEDGVEDEDEGDFQVPEASGRFVYSTAATLGLVAVIDSETLAIEVVGVGQEPTIVRPLGVPTGDAGAVAVLNRVSEEVSILRTDRSGTAPVDQRAVTPGANNLAASPDGAWVFAYHDVDGPVATGPGSDQELTALDTAEGGASYEMTVGAHPRDVKFSPDGSRAYVVTADGVNVLPIAELASLGKPDVIPVVDDPGIDPERIEIHVAAKHGIALARIEKEPILLLTDLSTGQRRRFDLEAPPTDLDLAEDETFAIATVRRLGGSSIVELALPAGPGATPTSHDVGDEFVGLAELAADGQTAILYTTVVPDPDGDDGTTGTTGSGTGTGSGSSDSGSGSDTTGSGTGGTGVFGTLDGDPRNRVSILRREGSGWGQPITLFNDVGIESVGIAPDSASAILIHTEDEDDAAAGAPWSYTLVDLSKEFPVKKRQTVDAPTGAVLFTPEGDRAVVLARLDSKSVKRAERVDLRTFVVEGLDLGSPPEGAGFVPSTGKIFVSQEHPTGRITFISPEGLVETLTGFVLNDAVKD